MFRRFGPLYSLILANLIMLSVLLFRFNLLPPQIPLFYSKPPGEDQLADTWNILLIPVLMNFLYVLNNIIYPKYFKQDDLLKKIFYYLNLFIIISFTLILIKIIFVIT